MNLRPSGYEPDELPDCSTPHQEGRAFYKRPPQAATPKVAPQIAWKRLLAERSPPANSSPSAASCYLRPAA